MKQIQTKKNKIANLLKREMNKLNYYLLTSFSKLLSNCFIFHCNTFFKSYKIFQISLNQLILSRLGYEDELMELKSNVEHLKETVTSKMERKEYLLRLMKLKQKLQSNVFDIETFKSYINENLAQQIQVPLPVSYFFFNSYFFKTARV